MGLNSDNNLGPVYILFSTESIIFKKDQDPSKMDQNPQMRVESITHYNL